MLFPGCPPMSLQQDCKRWIKYIKHVMSSGQLAKLSVCASVRQSVSFYTCLRVPSLPACLFASVEVCLSACQCLHVLLCAIYAACLNLLPSICAMNVCLSACLSVFASVYVIFCSFNPSFLPSFMHPCFDHLSRQNSLSELAPRAIAFWAPSLCTEPKLVN